MRIRNTNRKCHVFYLSHDVLEVWMARVEPVHVGVHGELRQGLPGWLVAVDIYRVQAQGGALMPH